MILLVMLSYFFVEFIEKVHDQYQSLIQTQRSPRDPVVVPSGTDDTSIHQNSHHPADGVDAMQYFRAVFPLCDRSNYRYMIHCSVLSLTIRMIGSS